MHLPSEIFLKVDPFMGVSKNRGTPEMDGLQWKTLLKWMIWGYHHFRKHPFILPTLTDLLLSFDQDAWNK